MKKLISLIMAGMICFVLCSCGSNELLQQERDSLKAEIEILKAEKYDLEASIFEDKVESGTAKYIVTFNIRQLHFTLDLSEHIKDSMNDVSIQIPVDKEYYDNVNVGDVIDDSFRVGSLVMNGSFGSWKVTVEDKEIR